MTRTLLEEIMQVLSENGKSLANIVWIGFHNESSNGYGRTSAKMNIKKFITVAEKVKYENGFAKHQLLDNFVIVGNGWWLETHLDPSKERLVFKKIPKMPCSSRDSDSLPKFPCHI